ncbi:MAG: DUF1064 domain-containing protein [Chloroflexi bacterium]|nr:DUF1064 domain-containing protein [Chloroflexota bacterium]
MRPGKYGNVPTPLAGHTFASKAEARRYAELALLESAGHIYQLEVHPPFPLVVNGQLIGTYRADFSYVQDGRFVCEDVKGARPRDWPRTKKLMRALYDIDVVEIAA